MENAVDAMKMAFAMLVFIVALSLAMYSFTMVRQTSDRIAQESDTKEYYDRISLEETGETTGISSSALAASSRIVGVETVIPTLYRYYKENYTVLFYKATNYDRATGTFSSITPMVLYYTETDDNYLKNSSLIDPHDTRGVFGFDIQDEQVRREPWSATEETDFSFIRAFINGTESDKFYTSKQNLFNSQNIKGNDNDGLGPYYRINFSNELRGLIGKDLQFIERYGEYNSNSVVTNSGTEDNPDYQVDSSITGSVDVLDNDEIVTKRNQTTKRVIQYILIN